MRDLSKYPSDADEAGLDERRLAAVRGGPMACGDVAGFYFPWFSSYKMYGHIIT